MHFVFKNCRYGYSEYLKRLSISSIEGKTLAVFYNVSRVSETDHICFAAYHHHGVYFEIHLVELPNVFF